VAMKRPNPLYLRVSVVVLILRFGICQATLMPYSPAARAGHDPAPIARENAKERAGRWRVHWVRR
jgi:hypothetical protein